jgi:hypothetical protein
VVLAGIMGVAWAGSDDTVAREFSAFRQGRPVEPADAVGREFSAYGFPVDAGASDAASREFAAFGQSPPVSIDDAASREFSAYKGSSPAIPDGISREFSAFRLQGPLHVTDAVSRDFSVYNDTLNANVTDAVSRDFSAYRPGAPAAITDAASREAAVWCLTPADTPKEGVPAQFLLRSARPNPFERTTELTYGLPWEATVSLEVYDAGGRLTAQVLREKKETAGWHTARIDGAGWPSGVYFYRFRAGEIRRTGKIVVHR